MENLGFYNKKDRIAARIMAETMRLNNLDGQPSAEDVEAMPLDYFQEAFEEYGEDFLSDELLEDVFFKLESRFFDHNFKLAYPEGTKILVAALPCNINGTLYEEEDIQDGEYLNDFVVNESTGLSLGFGAIAPTTHAKMLPKEIQEQCAFKIHYGSELPFADENDFENFKKQYTEAYQKLRKLLKGE